MAIYDISSDLTTGVNWGSDGSMDYIPTLYAGKLLVKFYEASVLGEIANTDYEGMIRQQGDSVIIRQLPTITVNDHSEGAHITPTDATTGKGMNLTYEEPVSTSLTLLIDQGKYWAFRVDTPDEVQTDLKGFINDWTEEASYELRNKIEIDILGSVYADAGIKGAAAGMGVAGTPLTVVAGATDLTATPAEYNILEKIVDCGTKLDENNVPDHGRWFLMPPHLIGLIKKSDLKDASLAGDATSIIRNGLVGMIDRFKIYRTNNLAHATETEGESYYTLFGTKHAITFASQLIKSESLKNQDAFGMLYRGLHVYGFKVVKADALGTLYCTAG